MKRIILTGPTGAIGIALIQQMIAENVQVIAVCNPKSLRNSRIPKSPLVHIVKCDLCQLDNLLGLDLPKCDVFYHLGWSGTIGNDRNNLILQAQNLKYAINAVDVAHALGCVRFIGAGSQAEYGRVEGTLTANTPTNPENAYGIAKLCAGMMTRLRCHQLGMEHIWIRVLSIYGPYDSLNTMVMSTLRALLSGKSPKTTMGEQIWDYLFSTDAGKAFYLAGNSGKDGAVYCLGSGQGRPLSDYIKEIRNQAAPEAKIDFGAIPYSSNQVMYLCADITNLQNDTGFSPETSFDEGIRQTMHWYQKEILGEKE